MRHILLSLLLVFFAPIVFADNRYDPHAQFVLVSTGVGGGIAPKPIQSQILVIAHNDGTTELFKKQLDDKGSYRCTRRSVAGFEVLVAELEKLGTFGLPQVAENEDDDIYRREIGLEVHAPHYLWVHRPPVGCCRSLSGIKPSQAQSALFEASVQRVQGWAAGGQTCSLAEMNEALQALYRK